MKSCLKSENLSFPFLFSASASATSQARARLWCCRWRRRNYPVVNVQMPMGATSGSICSPLLTCCYPKRLSRWWVNDGFLLDFGVSMIDGCFFFLMCYYYYYRCFHCRFLENYDFNKSSEYRNFAQIITQSSVVRWQVTRPFIIVPGDRIGHYDNFSLKHDNLFSQFISRHVLKIYMVWKIGGEDDAKSSRHDSRQHLKGDPVD